MTYVTLPLDHVASWVSRIVTKVCKVSANSCSNREFTKTYYFDSYKFYQLPGEAHAGGGFPGSFPGSFPWATRGY